jgi:RHS repeat-associated protein
MQAQGGGALIGEAQHLGSSLFADSRYSSPPSGHTGNQQYVKDLYMAYLQRDPATDTSGWNFWTGVLDGGETRANVQLAFAVSSEFVEGVAKLCAGTSSGTSTSGNLKYVLTDVQGSTRLLMENNSTSSLILARHDYLPFGSEIYSGVGSRTTSQKYAVTDKVRQRFAMTERDEASGLDHTLFRKNDSVAGRWTSPDPYGGSMRISDPQSMNRYAYVENDPVNSVDPSGLDGTDPLGPPPPIPTYLPMPSGPLDVVTTNTWAPMDSGMGGFTVLGGMGDDTGMIIVRDPLPNGGGASAVGTVGGTPNVPQKPTPTPTPNPNCGVNPISGQPGFTQAPVGQPGHLRAPVNGRGEFGAPRGRGTHKGLDIAGTLNASPIYSNRDGTVSFAGRTAGDGGWMVIVNQSGGVETRYAHLQPNSIPSGVAAGNQVTQGQQIGIVGNTGNAGSAPPHVHFGVRKNGAMVDPETYLNNPC